MNTLPQYRTIRSKLLKASASARSENRSPKVLQSAMASVRRAGIAA